MDAAQFFLLRYEPLHGLMTERMFPICRTRSCERVLTARTPSRGCSGTLRELRTSVYIDSPETHGRSSTKVSGASESEPTGGISGRG